MSFSQETSFNIQEDKWQKAGFPAKSAEQELQQHLCALLLASSNTASFLV